MNSRLELHHTSVGLKPLLSRVLGTMAEYTNTKDAIRLCEVIVRDAFGEVVCVSFAVCCLSPLLTLVSRQQYANQLSYLLPQPETQSLIPASCFDAAQSRPTQYCQPHSSFWAQTEKCPQRLGHLDPAQYRLEQRSKYMGDGGGGYVSV